MIDQQWSQQVAPRIRRDPAPTWPFLLSLGQMAGYFAFGYFIPVGPNCSAVFGDQSTALSADAAGMRGGRYTTDWVGACSQAASAQAPLCWTLLALSAVAAIVGLALRQIMRGKAAAPTVADTPGRGTNVTTWSSA